MRFLHSAALLRPPPGIVNQMRWEYEAANELKLEWDVRLYCPKGWIDEGFIKEAPLKAGNPKRGKPSDWLRLRYGYYRWLLSEMRNYDGFVLRYYVHDPFQLMFVRRCSKPVYFVHHTLEEPELRLPRTFMSTLRSRLENFIGPPTLKASDGLIGVTQEILNYEASRLNGRHKPMLTYPNGIKFDQPPVRDKRKSTPELLFVASRFAPWHGLDLLLDAIESSNRQFKLHLVGNLSESDLIRAKRDARIVIHGIRSSEQIRSIAEKCWLGLSSFGLHRQNMSEACTLKVREYLMMGLPVYIGHHDVIQEKNAFIESGEASIDNILDYCNNIYTERTIVAETSRANICKKMLLKKLHKELINQK